MNYPLRNQAKQEEIEQQSNRQTPSIPSHPPPTAPKISKSGRYGIANSTHQQPISFKELIYGSDVNRKSTGVLGK